MDLDIDLNIYRLFIKTSLDRIHLFQFDSLLNDCIRLHGVTLKSEDGKNEIKGEEGLITSDKFHIKKQVWKKILETLYKHYLPNVDYNFNWEIEITPYTLTMCELSKELASENEIELFQKITQYTDNQIENNFKELLENSGISESYFSLIPNEFHGNSKKELLKFLFRLMNFPPLGELSLFYNHFYQKTVRSLNELASMFSSESDIPIPEFKTKESLHYSYFHLSHKTYISIGIDKLINNTNLKQFKDELEKIKSDAPNLTHGIEDEIICSCCGNKINVNLPEEVMQYKLILHNPDLSRMVGLEYINEFLNEYKENLSDLFSQFFPNLNRVDNPDCYILVEGESEEIALPILAFRKRFILSEKKIQVYNAGSKEKLEVEFRKLKKLYPNKKIIGLLDSDAVKERNDIERIIKDQNDKYRLFFIENGTFEDIFDLDSSVEILNEIYPDGENVLKSDFKEDQDFVKNVGRILWEKKKAKFDKVLFAKKIALTIDTDKLPQIINDMILLSKDFTKPTAFIKK